MRERFSCVGMSLVLIGGLAMTGCASRYGPQRTTINYYPQCYQPVAQLRQDENSVGKSTAAGAAGGALLGALIGGLASGKVEGALAGAAVGGVGGAVAGHAVGKSNADKRDAAYLSEYTQRMGSEAAGMNRATAAAKLASQCYDDQFKQAVSEFKSGRITREDLQQRYTEIRTGLEETSYILQETSNSMARRDVAYQEALSNDYTAAKPSSVTKASTKPVRGKRPAPAVQSETNAITAQASEWKTSREEMDNTRRDVDSRVNRYEETVNNLLG